MKKVHSNILAQDCYIREITPKVVRKSEYKPRKFTSLVEVSDTLGIRYELKEFDYPVTPESVKSYVDSTDYKRDPAAAIGLPARGVNLGDMTTLQSIVNSDVSAVRSTLEKLQAAMQASAERSSSVEHTDKNVEVNDE